MPPGKRRTKPVITKGTFAEEIKRRNGAFAEKLKAKKR